MANNKEDIRKLLKKLRKYEISIRKAITTQLQGDFHSVFKGSGITFDDVREYQYGDDIRSIDWNATAKGHSVYVKTYKEEREQIVYMMLDVSASQEIGDPGHQKVDIGKEICGVLTLSAIKEASQVGLLCFSDQKEAYVKPSKGEKHAYQIITKLYNTQPVSTKTNLQAGISYLLNIIKRRSIIILISDFIDEDYTSSLKALARKHDLIVIHLSDKRETQLPSLGIIPVYDKESRKTIWVNSSSSYFQSKVNSTYAGTKEQLENFCRKHQADYLSIATEDDYIPKLINLFRVRNRIRKSA
ncbi:DUF58 domain-containing protein [Catalinimonas niigatensis]|uniref:DUF58 domain-containing protein n=1 Tax=Catalinimonas niigatensis TaxID=1397264 RepID=UPI002666407F|nr:DUF58 domain-containing protein [Catalinimonas niigatensis]WPP48138.1 DUF58 domain-containing protein [Catalinimonas niigatensis]